MTFQTTVRREAGHGVVGDIVIDGARRGKPGILRSDDPTNNVIGRGFSYVPGVNNDDVVQAGKPDAQATVFAGILANSKVYASIGTQADGALAPTLQLPNETNVELITFTSGIQVLLTTTANIGDNVYLANADGQLAAGLTAPANHTEIPGAKVVRHSIDAPGLAVIELTLGEAKYPTP